MWLVNNNSDDTVTLPRKTFCHQWIFKYLWACKQDIVITYFKQRSRVFHFNFTSFDTNSFTWSYLILDNQLRGEITTMSGALGNLCPSAESSVATAGQIWYIRDFPRPVGSVTNVSLPPRKQSTDLVWCTVRQRIPPTLSLLNAKPTAFSNSLAFHEGLPQAAAIFVLERGRRKDQ